MDIYTSLEDRLWKLSTVISPDVPVVFGYENGREPSESYIMINVLSVEQEGESSIPALLNRDRKLDVRVWYSTLVQFSFYGSEAGKNAHNYIHLLNAPQAREEMSRSNVAILTKTRLRRSPQRRETEWVDAFSFDARFNYIVNTPLDVEHVESTVQDYRLTRG